MLKPGIYEQVINAVIREELSNLPDFCKVSDAIDGAEASKVLAGYLQEIIRLGLERVRESGGNISYQINLANRIVETIAALTQDQDCSGLIVDECAQQLLAILSEESLQNTPGLGAKSISRPETSIAQSSLFTGAVHEPQMYSELKKETASADEVDMLVSFIKWSGLRLIIDELKDFTQRGGKLRVVTTSYMGATDIKAIEELSKLPNTDIKLSYDTKRTRLHAKTYIFRRNTGFSTAYVGSSNLSNAAISSGLEWNTKITAKDLPEVMQKITATFDSYWNSGEFEFYDQNQREKLSRALKAERYDGEEGNRSFVFDIRPYPFQQEILDKLQAEREVRGRHKNLVVAATGTGKTVISAFDYRRFTRARTGSPSRMLFVAHREEILKQSLDTFRGVLRDPNFGELFVGRYIPEEMRHLFVSIQTLNSQQLCESIDKYYYDYIVVDEFHHAAASSYRKMLEHFEPKILLGLTATPERMDGRSVLTHFDNRIAAEIRLPEAIDRKLLCPFQYFGVTDTVDLNELSWVRGGYDRLELSNLYSINRKVAQRRADHIVKSVCKYATDIHDVKGLGFCVSVEHAKFMAEHFNERGIPSMALTALSENSERSAAKRKLVSGEVRFIFVVDIYNEGVDIPEANTVLFLRPTESLTVFLQQLGRGLRISDDKECLTVLDFIGQANRKYSFEDKFTALLSNTNHSIEHEIKNGFISAPKGCYIQLEKIAQRHVLNNLRQSFSTKPGIISRIATFEEDSGLPLNLANFANYYHLDARTIYRRHSFTRLCVLAGVRPDFIEPAEDVLARAFRRIVAVDSRRWIAFLLDILPRIQQLNVSELSLRERRMLQMFYITLWQEAVPDLQIAEMPENLLALAKSPVMIAELMEILQFSYDRIDFIDESFDLGLGCPLDLFCTYTRDQSLVAMDFLTPASMREGVKWLPEKQLDLLYVTLNKSERDYSPSTMYNDYSINETLFHWQSQSTTAEISATGQRYIHHKSRGSRVLLFVREYKTDIAGTAPYTFLGTANYVQHTGSRPMNIIWKLDHPIPAKYIKKTGKLMAG